MAEERSPTQWIPAAVGKIVETAAVALGAGIAGPPAALFAEAVGRCLLGRLETGKQILLSQLQRSGVSASDFRDADQFAAGALRYFRAARDQAADINLAYLAKAMIGLARRQELWASDFLRFAESIAHLTPDELLVIGSLMEADREWHAMTEGVTKPIRPWVLAGAKLMPEPFKNPQEVGAIAAMAQRSGLIYGETNPGAGIDELSPQGRRLREILDGGALPSASGWPYDEAS